MNVPSIAPEEKLKKEAIAVVERTGAPKDRK